MLQLAYKHKILKAKHWDELSANELIELFRRINASWYGVESRLELSKWIYSNQCSQKFTVKKITAGKLKFYGPADAFRTMTMGEFLFADTYYFMCLRDKTPELLNKFIATIFRERKSRIRLAFQKRLANRDIRFEFDETLITARAKLLESVPQETKQAILFNYGAVRKDMTVNYKYLFPEKNVILSEAKNLKPKPIEVPQWDKWMWKLASGNTDEDFDKVANSLCRNVLKKIDSLIEESKKRKK